MIAPDALGGGFADAPVDAARAFRAALEVMSRPGKLERAEGAAPPSPMPAAAGALALTLCDPETPLWLSPSLRTAEVEGWLRFHCGAPLVGRERAMFAFGTSEELAPAEDFSVGTSEYPDRSCTLVVLVEGFEGASLALTGPGVKGEARLALGAACGPVMALLADNRALFPQGRDLFLVAGDRLAGLPRSVRAREV